MSVSAAPSSREIDPSVHGSPPAVAHRSAYRWRGRRRERGGHKLEEVSRVPAMLIAHLYPQKHTGRDSWRQTRRKCELVFSGTESGRKRAPVKRAGSCNFCITASVVRKQFKVQGNKQRHVGACSAQCRANAEGFCAFIATLFNHPSLLVSIWDHILPSHFHYMTI